MKGIIIYKTQLGTTKKYADWLSEELGFKTYSVKDDYKKALAESDTVIIGCSIFANKPRLASWLKSNWDLLKDKKVICYTTSGTHPENQNLPAWYKSAVGEEIFSKIKYFPFGGRLILKELNWLGRFMMKLGARMEKDPEISKKMLEDVDNLDRKYIFPLVDYIRS